MMIKNPIRRLLVTLFTAVLALFAPQSDAGQTPAASPPLNAFLVTSLPDTYDGIEKFFFTLRDGGANAVIVGSEKPDVLPDRELLPNLVYLAHRADLKIFLILPIRMMPEVLNERPGWEDMRYDLASGTIQPTGKLDLFNPAVVSYLVDRYKDIASYVVDGILFGVDFYYSDTEGMSTLAQAEYKKRFDKALVLGRVLARVGSVENTECVLEYGDGFSEWTTLKSERLVETVRQIMAGARTVNSGIQFGIPLHPLGLSSPEESFTKYACDMKAFQSLKLDYYWIAILHRNIRTAQGLTSYRKSMEELARLAQAATTTVKEPCKLVIALQTSTGSKMLPYSEIEEATAVTKKRGDMCIAYRVDPFAPLPASFTKKLFKR